MTTGVSAGGGFLTTGAGLAGCAGEVTPGISLNVGRFVCAEAVNHCEPVSGTSKPSPATTAR